MTANGLSFEQEIIVDPVKAENLSPERFNEIVEEAFLWTMQLASDLLHGSILKYTSFVTGFLQNSIQPVRAWSEVVEHVEVFGEVGSSIKYAAAVELGTKPHLAPRYPLWLWAKRKYGLSEGDAWAVAVGTQKRIAEHGTKGQFMFKQGLAGARADIDNLFANARELILQRVS